VCSVSSVVHGLSGFGDDARIGSGDELWFDPTRHPAGQKIKPRNTQNTRKAETAFARILICAPVPIIGPGWAA
jgi:hypothetical protein